MDEFVKRLEFDNLKEQVEELKEEMSNSKEMLTKIDKKLDVISECLKSNDTINELKNENISKQVSVNTKEIDNIRGNLNKAVWAIIGETIGLIMLAVKTFFVK